MAKKKWLQKASQRMKSAGTAGAFTRYCRAQGYGGVTAQCIAHGLKSKDAKIRKRAAFAKAARTIARQRKRRKRE